MSRDVLWQMQPVEMGRCKAQRVAAVNCAEVIDTGFEMSVCNLCADGVKQETCCTDAEPDIVEIKVRNDFNPDFGW